MVIIFQVVGAYQVCVAQKGFQLIGLRPGLYLLAMQPECKAKCDALLAKVCYSTFQIALFISNWLLFRRVSVSKMEK